MSSPLGQIVDANSNTSSVDTWALVMSGVVINTISATTTQIEVIQADYDYSVDLSVQGQSAGIGWTYTPGTDTFATPPPPPIDWIEVVEEDFDAIANDLLQCLSDATSGGSLSNVQLATAFGNALNDSLDSFSANQLAIMNSIYQYILNGG